MARSLDRHMKNGYEKEKEREEARDEARALWESGPGTEERGKVLSLASKSDQDFSFSKSDVVDAATEAIVEWGEDVVEDNHPEHHHEVHKHGL